MGFVVTEKELAVSLGERRNVRVRVQYVLSPEHITLNWLFIQ